MGEGIELAMSLRFDELVGDAQLVSNIAVPAMNRDELIHFLSLMIPHRGHS